MDKKKKKYTPRRPGRYKSPARRKKAYSLIVNTADFGFDPDQPVKLAQRLQRRLRRSGWECHTDTVEHWKEFEKAIAQAIRNKPFAIIVFGGDGSVRFAAARISRAKGLLGIVPTGLHNNIFLSLFGHTDAEEALNIIRAGYQTRIDAGLANGAFFLGSLTAGLVPHMINRQGTKKLPRLAMTWAQMAGKAADATVPRTMTLKMDNHTVEAQPIILNIHLLSHVLTLPFAPAAAPDDGRVVMVYDENCARDKITGFIRALKKDKYQYLDKIKMIRGHRLSISPAEGHTWMMDSEEVEFSGKEIVIEALHRVLRVFTNAPRKK
ncbi:MAG: diacylglycerol kinase family protein [candidate division Zixibacteria bacterium]